MFLLEEIIAEEGTGNEDLENSVDIGTVLKTLERGDNILVSDNDFIVSYTFS